MMYPSILSACCAIGSLDADDRVVLTRNFNSRLFFFFGNKEIRCTSFVSKVSHTCCQSHKLTQTKQNTYPPRETPREREHTLPLSRHSRQFLRFPKNPFSLCHQHGQHSHTTMPCTTVSLRFVITCQLRNKEECIAHA